MPTEFLIYGEGEAINHLRVLIQAEDEADASRIVDANIALWREAISVTSMMATAHYAAAATFGANSSIHPVMFGEGGKDTPLAGLNTTALRP